MSASRPKALWDFAFLISGETISKVAGFIAFAYLARILTPQGYGAVEVAVAILALFSFIVDFGFNPIAAREIIRNPELTKHYAALIPATRFVLIVVCIPAMYMLAIAIDLPDTTLALVQIYAFSLLAASWIQLGILQGLDQMQLAAMSQSMRMLIFSLGVVLFVHSPDDLLQVGYIEITSMIAMALFFMATQYHLGIPIRLEFDFKAMRKLLLDSYALGLSLMLCGFSYYLPTLFMATFAQADEIAWFAAAHRVVISAVTYSSAYHFNLFPVVMQHLKHSRQAYLKLAIPSYRICAWGGTLLALSTVLISGPVCELMFGKAFEQAGIPLAILIWILPLTLLIGHAQWSLTAIHKQRYVVYSQVNGLIINIIASVILIPLYDYTGAAIALLLSTVVVWMQAYYHAEQWVAKTPYIRLLLLPLILAALVLYLVFVQLGLHWTSRLLGPAIYVALALLLDKSLLEDLHILLSIKNKA